MILELTDIGKKYGSHWIFQGVNASFQNGSVNPITGSNGSGKSTLLQVISGYVTPNRGTIRFATEGTDVAPDELYRHVSIAAPYTDLFEEFTVEESVLLHHKLKPLLIDPSEVIERIALHDHKDKVLSKLSSGMKQRLKLALSIFTDSRLLLLDEPCSNLDEAWIEWYNSALAEFSSNRITVICSNSRLEEIRQATSAPLNLADFSGV